MKVKGRKITAGSAAGLAGLAVLCILLLTDSGDTRDRGEAAQNVAGQSAAAQGAAAQNTEEQSTAAQSGAEGADKKGTLGNELLKYAGEQLEKALYLQFVPALAFAEDENRASVYLLEQQLGSIMPFYRYARECSAETGQDVRVLSEKDMEKEASRKKEGGKELAGQGKPGKEPSVQGTEENQTVEKNPAEGEETGRQQEAQSLEAQALEELLAAENAAALQAATEGPVQEEILQFLPHTLQKPIALEQLQSYETLVKEFYTIDANTMAGSDQLDAAKLFEKDLSVSGEGEGPQILIFHTHSQETFSDSVPGDPSTSIMGVGDHLEQILSKQYGYRVLHHKGEYDVDTRDDAYSRALPAITQVLEENPSIQVVIDLHRDQMPEETRLVMDLDGRPTARFMFFNGLSRTRKTGNISYLQNENQEENLAFSFQMQLAAAQYYPGLTRKIYLKGYRYNMHLRPRYLLVELGAQNNTVEEAMNACDPLAHILYLVLSGEAKERSTGQ